jgi:F-type H+-transporting ATPase subunit delta
MLAQEVAKTYAQALFLSVKEKSLVDSGYEQLGQLRGLVEKDPTLLNFLNAPQVLDEHKLALVRDVFTSRMERLFVEFLVVLVRKHRVGYLPEIIDEFTRLVEAENGVGRVTVITAAPLAEAERTAMSSKLAAKLKLKIELQEKLDKSIMGGVIVITHNEIIDGSVRHGLELLEEQLGKVKVH